MKRNIVIALIVLTLIVTVALGTTAYINRINYRTMTKSEADQCDRISVSAFDTGTISESDLNWAIGMLQTPSWTGRLSDAQQRHLEVMVSLKRLRSFAPGQKEQLYEATAGFLTSRDNYERIGAMAVMRAIKDKRAVPAVSALLNTQDSFTRQMADKTLAGLRASGSHT